MFLTAERIHNGLGWLPQGAVIEVADDGTVVSIVDGPVAEATYYDGVLVPGFVNAHSHLELSHMKGVVAEHTGLIPFLKNIPQHRNDFTDEQKKVARHAGYKELIANGVVAIGDISNTADTADIRSMGGLHFHTFVEALGFNEANAPGNFGYAQNVFAELSNQESGGHILRQSIVPHAPYSVSSRLFKLIDAHEPGSMISIHNQESADEDMYYKTKGGRVPELLSLFGIDDTQFTPSGKSSLQTYLEWMSEDRPFMFVHNTCSTREDVQFAHSRLKSAYWCLCPNANLYIENNLPDIHMLMDERANICIGTDSLSSNHQLNIIAELVSIKSHFPQIGWDVLFQWATSNGASALQMKHIVGTIENGKKPGILQVLGTEHSTAVPSVNRIV
jgi:aminodeoxyfutalosine deaminase